ncbi:unnamed protein product [Cylicocyclus nassatus]|uniref:Uncharacterized protein n=1 Tax=Cylicocyclus nassatus TaxID=53992 RepID=A0AA36M8R9_CYLNA|nr:unnamed protein product [Cylicocyclus nassatus]
MQQNGPNGDTLPAALEMQTLNWSCELEKQARIALNDECPKGDHVADFANAVKDKAGIFQTKNVDTDNEETNSITEVMESFLNNINNEPLTDISAGVKYSGEANLREYADVSLSNLLTSLEPEEAELKN